VSLHQLFENNEADRTHLYNMGITTDMSIVDCRHCSASA
jgi:hypothetical protein